MIECEFMCLKGSGKVANCKIKIIASQTEMNVCNLCLEYFTPSEIKILERY